MFWAKRRLLWRVRRRLVITYLFIGLTPIVLLALLGFLSAMAGSGQAMTRIVTVQVSATEKQSLAAAHNLADSLRRMPPNTNDGKMQAWLDERTALLQAPLPGARVTLWRGGMNDDAAALGHGNAAPIVSELNDENTRGVGSDTTPTGAPLPEWLYGRDEWSGLAYMPPPTDSKEVFGTPAVRALVRGKSNKAIFALLLTVPVSRAFVKQLRESTGIYIHPYFVGASARKLEASVGSNQKQEKGVRTTASESGDRQSEAEKSGGVVTANNGAQIEPNIPLDQFGEPLRLKPFVEMAYPMFLSATDWPSGSTSQRPAFMINWSWLEASKQILGDEMLGQTLRTALTWVAVAFLILEMLALLSAAWMTRAVTGAVHKLYCATDFIKQGDFSHRVRIRSHDQLGELATAFNDMSANIESLLEERVKHERLEREVEIAAGVQAQLFPHGAPALTTVEVSGECRAARGVAGDYYDYIEVLPGLVAFALGDVSGKGISASLVMSNLQAALRAQTGVLAERLRIAERASAVAATAGGDQSFALLNKVGDIRTNDAVAGMAASVNKQLCQSTDTNRFVTLFLALYDDRTRLLRYTNAGHNAAILLRADGAVERLSTGGTVVGAFDWVQFEEAHATLDPGDLVIIFSDGISEAVNALGEEYGEERLAQLAIKHKDASVDETRRAIFAEIDIWSEAQERGDDQTVVVIKAVTGDE